MRALIIVLIEAMGAPKRRPVSQGTFFEWTTELSLKVEYFTKQTLEKGESHCQERKCNVQKFGTMNIHSQLGKWQVGFLIVKTMEGTEMAPSELWLSAISIHPLPLVRALKVHPRFHPSPSCPISNQSSHLGKFTFLISPEYFHFFCFLHCNSLFQVLPSHLSYCNSVL